MLNHRLLAKAFLLAALMCAGNVVPPVVQSAHAVPLVASLSPSAGPDSGGTEVTIDGNGFMAPGKYTAFSLGEYHSCAIASDGWVYCVGANWSGELGDGTTDDSLAPVAIVRGEIPAGVTIRALSAGYQYTCVLASNEQVYCWGKNPSGQLGNSTTDSSSVPVAVSQGAIPVGVTLQSISAGDGHTCALASNDQAYCWGWNYSGQLGDGQSGGDLNNYDIGIDSSVPVAVSGGAIPTGLTLQSISVGDSHHTCALASNGRAYCWGANGAGQLGNGTTDNSSIPVATSGGAIPADAALKSVTAGAGHTCALASNGRAYCWGANGGGQLGNGASGAGANSSIPVAVSQGAIPAGVTLQSVSTGVDHACALTSDTQVYCWGHNSFSQLGNNSTANSSTPLAAFQGALPAGVTPTQLSLGYLATCVFADNGRSYCVGYNGFGQFGDGTSRYRQATPVASDISSLPVVPAIASIQFGATPASQFAVVSDARLVVTTPPHVPGVVPVVVTDVEGRSTTYDSYTYIDTGAPRASVGTIRAFRAGAQSPAISGTVDDPRAVVTVTVGGATYTAQNNGDGTWTLPEGIVTNLSPGVYTVEVTVTNEAGNQTTVSTTLVIEEPQGDARELAETGDSTGVFMLAGGVALLGGAGIFYARRR